MKNARHVLRLAAILVVGVTSFIVVRRLLVPATFGEIGHYRAAAIEQIKSKPVRHAGADACVDCHSDVSDLKSTSKHAGIHCESCHGPGAAHAEDPDSADARPTRHLAQPRRLFCGACHSESISRPPFMRQVHLEIHYPKQPCTDCHQSHHPEVEK
ncbi:hypothetical protein HY522_09595 [bacterium]|nr:hypothetical protein [bacterium]